VLRLDRIVPESIATHKYSAIFGKEWDMIHNRMEGNSFNFCIGANGTGKTYAFLKRMEIMGVDENDEWGTLFDPDHLERHLFFDKQDMLSEIARLEKQTLGERRGYQILLDEAQMTANAKEWNNKEVLAFSKDMTTIRSSRLNIAMTMPTHRMITTDLRQLGTYQVEMFPADKMDLNKGIAYSKIHYLTLKPHLGELWRSRPNIKQRYRNSISDLDIVRKGKLNQLIWELPTLKTRKNYERMKKAFRDRQAENLAKQKEEGLKPRVSKFTLALEQCRDDLDSIRDPKNVFSWTAIAKQTGCGVSTAQRVAKFLKDEEGLLV